MLYYLFHYLDQLDFPGAGCSNIFLSVQEWHLSFRCLYLRLSGKKLSINSNTCKLEK